GFAEGATLAMAEIAGGSMLADVTGCDSTGGGVALSTVTGAGGFRVRNATEIATTPMMTAPITNPSAARDFGSDSPATDSRISSSVGGSSSSAIAVGRVPASSG